MYIYHLPNGPKMLQETLAAAQSLMGQSDNPRLQEHVQRLQDLINECQRMRPTGSDSKHGERHTEACGCSDELTEGERRQLWKSMFDPEWITWVELENRRRETEQIAKARQDYLNHIFPQYDTLRPVSRLRIRNE